MSVKKFSCIFFLCLGLSQFVCAANFADAMYDYQAENFSSAHLKFSNLASLGHKDSQFNIGAMYFRGQGVEQNKIEAYAWIALAAEDGDETRTQLRDNLLARFNSQDKTAALERAQALLALYSEESLQRKLVPDYLPNAESEYTLIEVEKVQPDYPRRASRLGLSGSVDVEYTIDINGHVKHQTIVASSNEVFDKAVIDAVKKWRFQPLLRDGIAISRESVRNRIYFHVENDELSEFSEKKMAQAFADLRYKSNSGVALDTYNYAYIADMLPKQKLAWEDINRLYFNAAQAGFAPAQYQLGLNLLYGKGCATDPIKALVWLNYAARANHPEAQILLASALMEGSPVAGLVESEEAWQWLERAVKAKYSLAMVKKAWLLATSQDDAVRDGAAALALINRVINRIDAVSSADSIHSGEAINIYLDKFTAYQTLAASQAEVGDFSTAEKTQRRVLKMAKDLSKPVAPEQQRLDFYSQKMPWREPGRVAQIDKALESSAASADIEPALAE